MSEIEEWIAKFPGQLKRFDRWEDDPGVEQHIDNGKELLDHIHRAEAAGCFVEVMSLKLQFADDWLRYFIKFKSPTDDVEKLLMFGKVVTRALELGLDASLAARLRSFAEGRNNALHGFVAGRVSYASVEAAARNTAGLVGEVFRWVLTNAGTPLFPGDLAGGRRERGDRVINVPVCLNARNPELYL